MWKLRWAAILKGTGGIIFFSLTSLSLASNYVLMMLAAFCRLEFTAVSLNLITSIMASSGITSKRPREKKKDHPLLLNMPVRSGVPRKPEKSFDISPAWRNSKKF